MKLKNTVLSFLAVTILTVPGQVHAANDFTAEYFNNTTLTGEPVLTRIETTIQNEWGVGSPDPSINNDNFSARWTGDFELESGRYLFSTFSDDGVRLWVNGELLIDRWVDQGSTLNQTMIDLDSGEHTIVLEYYEKSGGATAALSWELVSPDSATGLRIMPLGDSNTHGNNVPGGYRTNLKTLLPDINLVGTLQNGPAGLTDRDHEGHPGWRIDEIHANMMPWLKVHQPDQVLLLAGTNDIRLNYNLAQAPNRLSNLIQAITTELPDTDILVASLIPIQDSSMQQQVEIFNQAIPGVVQNLRDQGKKVHYVDMHTVLTSADLADNYHPTAEGYDAMGQKWAEAITAVTGGTLPEDPGDGEPDPDPSPEPDPDPVPPATSVFTAQYFNNIDLSGVPVVTREENTINYELGYASPHASVNSDFYSARWTGNFSFDPGTYTFSVTADDGVRLYIDGELVIDQWKDQGATTYTATRDLGGEHEIKMEYYERYVGSTAILSWSETTDTPPGDDEDPEVPTTDIPLDAGFLAEYFNNTSLNGDPAVTRIDPEIQNNWGYGSPAPGITNDGFSARWQGQFTFEPGSHRFSVTADDGVRLLIDGETVIDKWIDQGPTTYTHDADLDGVHTITMEYYENQVGAFAALDWSSLDETDPGEEEPEPTDPPTPTDQFTATYFNNMSLTGTPALERFETEIQHDWGLDAPDPSITKDYFSARWVKNQEFDAGTYSFMVSADDGVRLYVDDELVIDKWIDQPKTTYVVDLELEAGTHVIKMEYYERQYGATAMLTIAPTIEEEPVIVDSGDFLVEYFNNITLNGEPIYADIHPEIAFSWGLGSPHQLVSNDYFSLRALKTETYEAGTYRFTLGGDDGIRLYVDGELVIDQWKDQGTTYYEVEQELTAGEHTVMIEYYERTIGAELQFEEVKIND